MEKIYLIDTNVILDDPNFLNAFENNTIAIPLTVLEELDKKKKLMDEVGRNARYASKQLDELRSKGKLFEGAALDNGGKVIIVFPPKDISVYDKFHGINNDLHIIAASLSVTEQNPDKEVILVSKDVLVRVIGDAVGVKVEDYKNSKIITSTDDSYTGYTELEVESELINEFYREGEVISPTGFFPNHYVVLKCGKQSAITRYRNGFLKKLYSYSTKEPVFGLNHRNLQQIIALDLLLDPEIPLVTLVGKAGTGKTLLALAASLSQSLDGELYQKVLVSRPVVPMGNDIGYLPGEMQEKLRPWMQPIYDNLEALFNTKKAGELDSILSGYEDIIQVEALTYIRGRSIPEQFMIIDEAQNLTKHEIKTILTRIGEGAKIVLTGDPHQIDSPYLDQYSNGLTYVVEKFKDQTLAGHVTLTQGERSDFAQLAADIL